MELGYTILAEAFLRGSQLDEALRAANNLDESHRKSVLLREIRNSAIQEGRLDIHQTTSDMLGIDSRNPEDLATMFLANVDKQSLDNMIKVIDLLPEDKTKESLLTTAIIESAYRGHIVICERLAEKRGKKLEKHEAMIAKAACERQGWIHDAKRAAEVAGVDLSREDYRVMFVANKDKGLLNETLESAKFADEELTEDVWSALLLAAVLNNRANVWDIAGMF